jgi:membrane fusion protein (multidrug efflux system)
MSKYSSLKSVRKWILLVLGFVLIILSIQISKKIIDSNPPPRRKAENTLKEVYTLQVKNGPYQVQIPSNGVLRAYKRIQITARVQGVMQTIQPLFKSGQQYSAGQTLAKIEASEFRANVIAQRAALYNQITSVLPDLQLDFPEVYSQWSNYLKSFDLEQPTPQLPDMAENVRLFVSGRGIISSFYALQNLEQTLTFYQIKAPFSGVLVSANATEGSLIRPGQELGEFIAPGDYELMVALPKSYINNIGTGVSVALRSIDTNQKYSGVVSRINAKVNSQTQAVEVYIRVKDPALKEGMFMEAAIDALAFEDVFAVERGLLNGSEQLYVVENNKLVLRKVTPIHFTETLAIIRGLNDGEELIAQPLIGAYTGMEIKTVPFQQNN